MSELWKDVKNHEMYQVSNLGRVRRKGSYVNCRGGGKRFIKEHILSERRTQDGYASVSLFDADSKNRHTTVHRLVAEAFIPNPNNLPQVNHINEVRDDNRVDNLEWISIRDNANHATRIPRLTESIAKIQGKKTKAVNIATGEEFIYASQSEAAKSLGLKVSSVHRVVKGRRNQTGGYKFYSI